MSFLKDFVKNGRKIYGAALNYKNPSGDVANQIKEPVLFLKAPSDYITEGRSIVIPRGYSLVEELELGVIIGKTCKDVTVEEALDYVGGYCIALDMTASSELKKALSQKMPWTTSKTFDTSCPVSAFIPKEAIPDPTDVELFCTINGVPQQNGNTSGLVFSAAELISFISRYHTLEPNDMILTGTPPTPAGVKPGDVIRGGIKGGVTVEFRVEDK
ncbi:hypothetical protein PPYR_13160 [Photinus pyralis]|uniref:oxaloacetate tautomerase n=1 Tax=Photinus pyralis TaxID=7054 RepID=A0A5N4A895_PHOPY|nr:acylpyruvase FAHD1, mitochondrial-like [Photinus pyralis]KAB0793540.1 hypothetical protein PPYR_13160 [Photinus pyralis]